MRKFSRVFGLLLAFGAIEARAQRVDPSSVPVARPEETEPRILNDTREYCEELREDIARIRKAQAAVSAEALALAREGERLCRIGHIRPGIYRLRSALMMMRQ